MNHTDILTLEEFLQRWESVTGLNAHYMIRPSHRPYDKRDFGQGPVPSIHTILDKPHAFILEGYLRLDDVAISIQQKNDRFEWREIHLTDVDDAMKEAHVFVTKEKLPFRWIDVWTKERSPIHCDFVIERPAFGYFDGFEKKDSK